MSDKEDIKKFDYELPPNDSSGINCGKIGISSLYKDVPDHKNPAYLEQFYEDVATWYADNFARAKRNTSRAYKKSPFYNGPFSQPPVNAPEDAEHLYIAPSKKVKPKSYPTCEESVIKIFDEPERSEESKMWNCLKMFSVFVVAFWLGHHFEYLVNSTPGEWVDSLIDHYHVAYEWSGGMCEVIRERMK